MRLNMSGISSYNCVFARRAVSAACLCIGRHVLETQQLVQYVSSRAAHGRQLRKGACCGLIIDPVGPRHLQDIAHLRVGDVKG